MKRQYVYVVHAMSESCDHYYAAFKVKPSVKTAIRKMDLEREFYDEDFPDEPTGVITIEEVEVL